MGLKYLACLLLLTSLLAGPLAGASFGAVYMEVEGAGRSYGPGTQYLDANLTIRYNELIPKDTAGLYVYFDGESVPRGQVSLYNYLHGESYYTFQNQSFSYNLTASGTIRWYEYPNQYFSYRVSVDGLCGNESCYVGDPPVDICMEDCGICNASGNLWYGDYPCHWSISRTGYRQDSVNGDPDETGLKFIEDAGQGFGIPDNAVSGSVKWYVDRHGSPPEADVTMRAACGLMWYENSPTSWRNGWILKQITPLSGRSCPEIGEIIPATADCRVSLGHSFDDVSMTRDYRRFGGPPGEYPGGGIYKDNEYQDRGIDADWNGTLGEIILKDFDSNACYIAVYLPSNGPMVCAYTSYRVPKSSPWNGAYEIKSASAGYLNPYVRAFTQSELESISALSPPDCPIPPEYQHRCDKEYVSYGALEGYDPSGSVDISFDEPTLTVTGTVGKKIFTGYESFRVELALFDIGISDITQLIGNHTMTVVISDGETVYGKQSFDMFTCADGDGDGYCTENGDCDDNNHERHPMMPEVCNGIDDNCDGLVDEGIVGMGEQLGRPCNDWPGSICKGIYVCSADGTALVCLPESGIYPGQNEEVCRNGLDDDCDGATDEDEGDVIDGVPQPPCSAEAVWCIEEQSRPCGACRDGTSTCRNGKWQPCQGGREPETEVCNGNDDDCDGVIDNIGGKASAEETRCRCYGGASPLSSELCNDIDDDCNGLVDDGATNCCIDGNTRTCGTDVGACEFGIQTCQGGQWGPCTGSVNPVEELCCDELDNDCNGETDEFCSKTACDEANQLSMIYWVMMGLGVIIVIGVLIYTEFIKKKPAESSYT
jgi:hypothetical protein